MDPRELDSVMKPIGLLCEMETVGVFLSYTCMDGDLAPAHIQAFAEEEVKKMRFVLYNHVGSANHGCEALVRTISEMLGENQTVVLSDAPQEEIKYGGRSKNTCISIYNAEKDSLLRFSSGIYEVENPW